MSAKTQKGMFDLIRRACVCMSVAPFIFAATAAASTGPNFGNSQQTFNLLSWGHPSLFVIIAFLVSATAAALSWALSRQRAMKKMRKEVEDIRIADELKSKYIKRLSHEFRGPLNGIIGIAEFMADNTADSGVQEKSDVIYRSGTDLLSLIENIHYMILIESGELELKPRNVELAPVLQRLVSQWDSVITSTDVTYTHHIDASVPERMTLDTHKLSHCINHLMSNAVKFTDKGRIHLHITAKDGEDGEKELQIVVADTGLGIEAESLDRIFRPYSQMDAFEQRSSGRAGLGLAITQKLSKMLGGDVTVNSRPGRGSEFILTVTGPSEALEDPFALPKSTAPDSQEVARPDLMEAAETEAVEEIVETIEPEPAETVQITETDNVEDILDLSETLEIIVEEAKPEALPSANQANPAYRVLVVEDDLAGQNVVRSLLEPAGCKIACVPNGNFALQALQEHVFDFIIMDIRMPSMNGIETARIIRGSNKAYADIPIIATTADVSPETRTHCLAVGMNAFLKKPLIARTLFSTIDDVLHRPEERETA